MIILRERLYSEAGEKKLEERARKKLRKKFYELEQAKKLGIEPEDFLKNSEYKYLPKEEQDSIIRRYRQAKRKYTPIDPREQKNISLEEKEVLARSVNARSKPALENSDNRSRSRAGFRSREEAAAALEDWKTGPLRDSHDFSNSLDDYYKEKIKRTKVQRKLKKATRKLKKAAPWVIGGTATIGATAAGIKAYKKKKANKKDNK